MASTAKGVPLLSYRPRPHLNLPDLPCPATRIPAGHAHSLPGSYISGGAISELPFERHGLSPCAQQMYRPGGLAQKAVTLMKQGIEKAGREQPAQVDAYMQWQLLG